MTVLTDIVDIDDLDRGVAEGLIKAQFHPTAPLTIYNYTDKAMYTPGAWGNPAVRACRGLIVEHESQRVVARPWAKFFNHGQKEAVHIGLDEPVTVMDKLDGSLGIGYVNPVDDTPAIATRGSFSSDQAIHATEWFRRNLRMMAFESEMELITPLFEVIYPENRIVCDYGSRDELVLLGAVHIDSGITYDAEEAAHIFGWGGAVADIMRAETLADALALEPRPGCEGVVVLAPSSGQAMVKIKQEDYVALHRIVTGLSERSVWERMMAGDSLNDILGGIPDELHGWVLDVEHDLRSNHNRIVIKSEMIHYSIMGKCGSVDVRGRDFRREYAEHANQHPDIRPFLFMLLDGKDISKAVLKTLKPAGDKRPINRKEDVA